MSTDAQKEFDTELKRIASLAADSFAASESEQQLRFTNAKLKEPLAKILKLLPTLPKEKRKEYGKKANELKKDVETSFEIRLQQIHAQTRAADLEGPPVDVTLPGRGWLPGSAHPIRRVADELLEVFATLGFEQADGPEIDYAEYNFEKLGFPPDHPATDMQDSFFIKPHRPDSRKTLLRTHTSTIQVREMLRRKPPLAVVSAGAVYRRDDDMTHSPMFFQLEGFVVDKKVTFADLKGTLNYFLRQIFGKDVKVRFRPSYFPFVEPGGEVDIGCDPSISSTGWMEILGCGMIHPVVFEHVGYDPEEYSGFAFGMGLDRIAMLRYGIPNIRLLYDNDVRFLQQL